MKKAIMYFRIIVLVICMILLPCCEHTNPLVTQNAIIELYNNNSLKFNNTVDVILKDGFYNEIIGYYFFYEEKEISVYEKKTLVEYQLPTNVYLSFLECFELLDSVIDDSYNSKEYTILAIFDDGYKGLNFYINDETLQYTYCLTFASYPDICLETAPSWTYQINDNWFYHSWGQV